MRPAINTQSPVKKTNSVKLDYFLYSCFEFEQTVKANPHRSLGAERWPVLVDYFEGDQEQLSRLDSLKGKLTACLDWYLTAFPALSTDTNLNLDNINGVIPGIVFIGLDFKTIVSSDSTHEALIYNEARPNHELWELIDTVVGERLPSFTRQLLTYLQWAYGEADDKQWDIGSRPPVGRYAPSFRKGRLGARKEQTSRGGNSRGNRNGNSKGPRQGNSKGPRRHSGNKGSSEQKEKLALQDVEKAVTKLKDDSDLYEVRLAPANSFYRRLQHKHVISMGFESTSDGEGTDRSVIVRRSKDV